MTFQVCRCLSEHDEALKFTDQLSTVAHVLLYVISAFRLPYHWGRIRMDSLEYFRIGRALLAEKLTAFFRSIFNFTQNWVLREMYVALLFKNLRSSLETSHAYFMYKNTHCQDWPLPSLEVFAGSGWLHNLNVYQFVCGWHLFFPSVEYSNIQASAESISDKEPWGPFWNRNWLWLLFAVFFGGWNTKVRCRYFTPTFMHRQWYVKVNMCVFPAVVEKILSIPYFAWSLHNKTKYWADIESKKCELYKKWICKKSEGT